MEIITLNMVPKGITPVCHASQYDDGRVIRLNIVDELHGYIFTDEEVELRVRKPDDNVVTASVAVVSGNAYVDIVTTEQMTACEGDNECELRLTRGEQRIGSLNFKMRVEKDPLKDGIESETEIHNLETQIHDMNEVMLPGMVAEEVTRQYDSENVIFDDVPTENHGDGYTVNSAGLKSYIPKAIDELDDVEINNPQANQAIVYNPTTQKFENGEVSTVGGLNDLNDVTLENVTNKQELVYDGTDDVFKNKTTRVELTQAEYNQLVADDDVLPDVDYYITDAPSMQGTSAELSYDGDTDSVYDVVEEVKDKVTGTATIPFTGASGLSTNNCQIFKKGVWLVVCIEIVLSSDQSGWYDILTTDDDVTLPIGIPLFGVVSTDSESITPKYCQAYQNGTKMTVRIRNGKAAGQYRGQIIVPLASI